MSHVLDRGTGDSPNLPYFCIYGSSGWASVMVFPWEPNKGVRYGIRLDIKGFHMRLKACGYRKKGMMLLLRGIAHGQFFIRGRVD